MPNTSAIEKAIVANITNAQMCGQDWPADKMFCVVDHITNTPHFFAEEEDGGELIAELVDQPHADYSVYYWDWGPVFTVRVSTLERT